MFKSCALYEIITINTNIISKATTQSWTSILSSYREPYYHLKIPSKHNKKQRKTERSHMLPLANPERRGKHKQAHCWVTEATRPDQFPLPWNLNISLFTLTLGWYKHEWERGSTCLFSQIWEHVLRATQDKEQGGKTAKLLTEKTDRNTKVGMSQLVSTSIRREIIE